MDSTVGLKPLQIGLWEGLLNQIWEWFEADIIRDVISSFKILSHDDPSDEGISPDYDEYDDDSLDCDDDTLKLQQQFFGVLNNSKDKLQSARYVRDIMRVQRLHHEGEPMVEKVQVVLEQMKEYQRQEEVRANEIFVGRDRDIQLIFGLLGIQSSDTDLTSEDKAIILKYHRTVKGVYVSGIGGQGKTTLVRKICDDLRQSYDQWATAMISLRNKDSIEQVLTAILAKIGVLCSFADRQELTKRLLDFITATQQNTLICLDDCDAIDRYAVGKFLADLFVGMSKTSLQCKVRFLLTSRSKFQDPDKDSIMKFRGNNIEMKLGGWLADIELDSLADEEAVELLRKQSEMEADLDEDTAHSIATCCSLSPLAITMVSQLLKLQKFTPQQLLYHLKKDKRNVTKAMTVDLCIEESFQNFNEEMQASLIHLAVFQSSKFDLKSAAKILGTDTPKKLLEPLHDYHFLEVVRNKRTVGVKSDTEYSLHPLVYRFVAEKLKAGNFRETYNEAIVRFVDLMEGKIGRIFKMCNIRCKKGIAELEENKVHILRFYDFLLEEKRLLKPYPKTVKDRFVLLKKKVSDLTDLVLSDVKKRRLFISEAERAKESGCDAMQIFWTVEETDVILILHEKPGLALKKLNELPSGRFAALRHLYDQPDYPPLVMALFHKLKGQAFWKLLRYNEAIKHIDLALHFFGFLRPAESFCFLKAKLLEYKGQVLLDMEELDKGEETLRKAYDMIQSQVYIKDPNDVRAKEIKKQSLLMPRFFRHFGAIEIERARLEQDTEKKNKYLNKGLEYLCEGMELDKQLHTDSLDDYAAKMKLRADVYMEQGLLDEAQKYAEVAESQRRHRLQLPHINVTESVYQVARVYMMKGIKILQNGNEVLGFQSKINNIIANSVDPDETALAVPSGSTLFANDFFEELESDHLINGSIPTIRHPLYSKIKQHHIELYRVLHDKTKIHHVTKFYADIENGKYELIKKSFEDEFQRMMFTPQEYLDKMYDGGGEEFGANDNMMIRALPEGASGDRRDSGRGDSSVEGSLSSISEGGSVTDSMSRMNKLKSLSLEDDVFNKGQGVKKGLSNDRRRLCQMISTARYGQSQSPSAKTALDFDLAVSSATSPAGSQTSEDSVTGASKEEILQLLQKRTEKCRKLEAKLSEYVSVLKDKTKTVEKLEAMVEKQQDAAAKRAQELNEQYQANRATLVDKFKKEMEKKDQEKQELLDRLKEADIIKEKYCKQEELKEEIEGFATQELGKVKHMLLLTQEELSGCKEEVKLKTVQFEEEEKLRKDMENELIVLQGKLQKIETERTKLEEDSVEHGKLVSAMTKERLSLEEKIAELNKSLVEKATSVSLMESKYTELENNHQTLLRNSELHKTKTSQLLVEKDDHIEQLQDRVKTLEQRGQNEALSGDERIQALEKERDTLEKKLTETREQLSQIKLSWSEKISHLEDQISHLNGKIVEDNEELAQCQKASEAVRENLHKEIEELKEKLSTAEKKSLENLEFVKTKQIHYEKEKQELETALSKEKMEKLDLETQLRAKVTSLESQLVSLETAKTHEKSHLEDQITHLQKHEKELLEENLKTEKHIKDIEESHSKLKEEIQEKEKLCQILSEEKKSKEAREIELTSQISALQLELEAAKDKLEATKQSSKSKNSELQSSNKERDDLMLRNAELSQELRTVKKTLEDEKSALEEDIKGRIEAENLLQQKCDQLQESCDKMRQEVEELKQSHSTKEHESAQAAALQETVIGLEEQLADKNRALKKQEQRLSDLKKTLQRELKVQSLPNDEPLDPKLAALTPPLPRKSATRNSDTYHTRQSSQERTLFVNDSHVRDGHSHEFNSQNSLERTQGAHGGQGQSSHRTHSYAPNQFGRQSSAIDNVIELNSDHASVYSSQKSYTGNSRPKGTPDWDMRHLEKDVNFQYLKHVVMKFMLSRESEAIHLIKAVSLLLRFTPDEQKLMKDTLEWKMSWFGGSQPPAVLRGHANKIIPPSY